ncbi:MAG: DnaJ domain-containing protein [Verrucomicrobia bacterium]|nr:DnaJ domain-containing protein [Verrucomicrobiota bacterium]
MAKDYYLILRVKPQATSDEIRSAYRRRALELHPDQSGLTSDPFLELQEAYHVLSDPSRRAMYDRHAGEIPIKNTHRRRNSSEMAVRKSRAEPLIPKRSPHYPEDLPFSRASRSFSPFFEDIFDLVSGKFFPTAISDIEQEANMTFDVMLSPYEAKLGGVAQLLVPAQMQCPNCARSAFVNRYRCTRCATRGYVAVQYPVDVAFPAGLRGDYSVNLVVENLGGLELTVHFRLSVTR